MKSSVVIGANYGDEGKGLMTDYLCKKYNADLVIRFNGGAQAGHTVVTPEGERHVFGHIGSGYFLGVPTYLSEYFILNPILFKKEYADLKIPKDYLIYISTKSEITTYWDMMANRAMEEMRGDNPHGSCGVGINTTLDRADNFLSFNFETIAAVKEKGDSLLYILEGIHCYWKEQLNNFSLEIGKPVPEWVFDCQEKTCNAHFLDDLYFMGNAVRFDGDLHRFLGNKRYAIFEGAQGLALDQFYGNFPYVTRSNTGMRNVIDLQRKSKDAFSIDEIVYVTRTYETRHGNDPYFLVGSPEIEGASDDTNLKNEWQGELRYRYLMYGSLCGRIRLDLQANNLWWFLTRDNKKASLAFTHADQIPVNILAKQKFFDGLDIDWVYTSSGKTRNDVEESKKEKEDG